MLKLLFPSKSKAVPSKLSSKRHHATKSEEDSSVIPNNPFEIVEMIRRYNSLNDATQPSDAIEDALNSFNNFEQK